MEKVLSYFYFTSYDEDEKMYNKEILQGVKSSPNCSQRM